MKIWVRRLRFCIYHLFDWNASYKLKTVAACSEKYAFHCWCSFKSVCYALQKCFHNRCARTRRVARNFHRGGKQQPSLNMWIFNAPCFWSIINKRCIFLAPFSEYRKTSIWTPPLMERHYKGRVEKWAPPSNWTPLWWILLFWK